MKLMPQSEGSLVPRPNIWVLGPSEYIYQIARRKGSKIWRPLRDPVNVLLLGFYGSQKSGPPALSMPGGSLGL